MLKDHGDYIIEIFLQEFKNNLIHLYLYQITEIKENSFSGLINLRLLSLGGNQITEIKENSFRGLNNLQQLNLNFNKITEIKENDDSCSPLLQKLKTGTLVLVELRTGTLVLVELKTGTLVLVEDRNSRSGRRQETLLLAQHDEPFKSITKSVTDVSLSIIEGSLEEFRDIIKALPQKTEISTPGRPKRFIAIGISIAAMAMSTFNTVRITQLNEEISTL